MFAQFIFGTTILDLYACISWASLHLFNEALSAALDATYIIGSLMNGVLEGMWKETVVVYFDVLSRHLLRADKDNYGNRSRFSRTLSRVLNQGHPEYEIELLSIRLRPYISV
jgi:hypothetical protein